jgi:hypothetical protein
MARHEQRQAERDARHGRADIEHDRGIAQPDQPEGDRQEYCGDVVDGEGDRGGRRDVGRVGDLLEIGALRQDEGEEDAVDDEERSGDERPGCAEPALAGERIADEDRDQRDVFELDRRPLADLADEAAGSGPANMLMP